MNTRKNFSNKEFECKCGTCIAVKMDTKLLDILQKIRDEIKKPIKINSAYRCPSHNKNVGGSPTSLHQKGEAIDIAIAGYFTNQEVLKIIDVATREGITGLGIKFDNKKIIFLHLSRSDSKKEGVFSY